MCIIGNTFDIYVKTQIPPIKIHDLLAETRKINWLHIFLKKELEKHHEN